MIVRTVANRLAGICLCIGLLGLTGHSLGANGAPDGPWTLSVRNVAAIQVPVAIRAQLADLEYADSDSAMGVAVDLNGDGSADYVIQSAQSLCGNGGCEYEIFDGKTNGDLGSLFGDILVFRAKQAHALPVIDALSYMSAESASFTTYVFSGKSYAKARIRIVRGASLDSVAATLRRIPFRSTRSGR